MSAEKRPASNVFGSNEMVVKRQKSDANLRGGNAFAVVNGSAVNGALIQSVSRPSLAIVSFVIHLQQRKPS